MGHSWISIGVGKESSVYAYGRYDGRSGTSSGGIFASGVSGISYGPGVLVRLDGATAEEYNSENAPYLLDKSNNGFIGI